MSEDWRERFRSWSQADCYAPPGAPAGGSGPGTSRSLGFTSDPSSNTLHPDSPYARHLEWQSAFRPVQIVVSQSDIEKLLRAVRRSLPKLPPEVREKVLAILTRKALGTLAALAAVDIGAHWIGIGGAVDVVLILWGVWTLGPEALVVAKDLHQFFTTATHAQTERDVDLAADCFARAISIIGVDALEAILLHKGFKAVHEIGETSTIRPPKKGFEWTEARTLEEQIAMEQAKRGTGEMIMPGPFNDALYSGSGWEKFGYITYARDGNKIEIHYMRNRLTQETGQFKFISRGGYKKPKVDSEVSPGDQGPLKEFIDKAKERQR